MRLDPITKLLLSALLAGAIAVPAVAASEAEVNARIDAVLGDAGLYETTVKAFQRAVVDNHRQDVAAFVRYPIRIRIDGRKVTIKSAESFLARYDEIMTPDIVTAIKGQAYGDLFVNADGIMFGDGQVWINGICHDRKCKVVVPQVVTIQHAGAD